MDQIWVTIAFIVIDTCEVGRRGHAEIKKLRGLGAKPNPNPSKMLDWFGLVQFNLSNTS